MPGVFSDHLGRQVPYDGISPIAWRVSVSCVVRRDDRLLLMEPVYAPTLELPGGEVLPGETLVEGATRECWEETGHAFVPGGDPPVFVGEQWFFSDEDASFRHSLRFALPGIVRPPPDPTWRPLAGETRRVVWLSLAEIGTAGLHPHHRRVLMALGW